MGRPPIIDAGTSAGSVPWRFPAGSTSTRRLPDAVVTLVALCAEELEMTQRCLAGGLQQNEGLLLAKTDLPRFDLDHRLDEVQTQGTGQEAANVVERQVPDDVSTRPP